MIWPYDKAGDHLQDDPRENREDKGKELWVLIWEAFSVRMTVHK
jgi:hypothetical protein